MLDEACIAADARSREAEKRAQHADEHRKETQLRHEQAIQAERSLSAHLLETKDREIVEVRKKLSAEVQKHTKRMRPLSQRGRYNEASSRVIEDLLVKDLN